MLGAPRVCAFATIVRAAVQIWSLLSDSELICTKGVQIGVAALSGRLLELEVRHYGILGG
jgi:hypothetical protein